MLAPHIATQIYANFSFIPTLDQKKLITQLADFIAKSKNGDIFILNGYAGTGKTSLISALIQTFLQHKIDFCMMAPTGRAAKIMTQYSGTAAYTIHKKIFRQKSALENRFLLDRNSGKGAFFIVDEASMINNSSYENHIFGSGNLLDDLVSYVNNGKDCRLILVGDKAQLPPVGTRLSPALDPHEMERYAGKVWYGELREVVRQEKDSGILYNATVIRRLIERSEEGTPKFRLDYPEVKSITGVEFLEELETAYSHYGQEETIVITRSNKLAGRFNQTIRNRVLYQEEELSAGDILMIVKNNYHYHSEEENLDFIANGDTVRIRRLRNYEERYGFRFVDAQVILQDYNDLEMECKIMLDTLNSDAPALTQEQTQRLFAEVEKEYAHITRKKERYEKIREDVYFNALQVKFAYAVTCHKAQGGQWECVFIDRLLYGEERMTADFQRWLYTAVTRAKRQLFFLNFDDSFFENPPERW